MVIRFHPKLDQLMEIKKITTAKIICDNSDNLKYIQKNVFRGESPR